MNLRRDVFQAIADPTRRAILVLVASQAMTPGAIAEKFNSSRQTISKHIQILAECDLLKQKQEGREIYYYFNPIKMKEIADFTEPFREYWEARFIAADKLLAELKKKKK
jgi:DNA-binding transcriptional ArsR family regulator